MKDAEEQQPHKELMPMMAVGAEVIGRMSNIDDPTTKELSLCRPQPKMQIAVKYKGPPGPIDTLEKQGKTEWAEATKNKQRETTEASSRQTSK